MGIGGVLAGGCTVGSGLTGMSTLSFAAVIAILSVGIGGIFADRVIDMLLYFFKTVLRHWLETLCLIQSI